MLVIRPTSEETKKEVLNTIAKCGIDNVLDIAQKVSTGEIRLERSVGDCVGVGKFRNLTFSDVLKRGLEEELLQTMQSEQGLRLNNFCLNVLHRRLGNDR
jgi:hypothetical protein